MNSNPYGEDDEKDCKEDGGHVEEEDPKEEAEEWRRPGQAIWTVRMGKKPEVGLDDGEECCHLVEVFWEPGRLTLV